MPWLECLLFVAAVYILVVLVRGIIQGVAWFMDEFLPDSMKRDRREEKAPQQHHDSDTHAPAASGHRGRNGDAPRRSQRNTFASALLIDPSRWLAPLAEFARWLVFRKRYDYWAAIALGENDPVKKVKYYSKALKLEPRCEPGWKLKATALLQLKRYAEATECLDKVLEIHANATTWCRKGICCYHLKRYEEAVACFNKALAAGANEDDPFFEEASNCKKAAEEEIRQQGAVG